MHSEDRMANHQAQQACKNITNHSQTIPAGSFNQTHKDRHCRRHFKTIWKTNRTNTQIEQVSRVPTWNQTSDTQ